MPSSFRPPLRVWAWTAAVVALVAVAALLWRGSDAAATESTTSPPADVPPGTPAGVVSQEWSATGQPLPDDVVEAGRVLVGGPHGIRALDVSTGEPAWSYTRSNARLCDLTATDGVAVAVFATADRCDEAIALDAGTGVRAWTRNVDFRPDVTLEATDRIVLAGSPTGVVTLDPIADTLRWRYSPPERCRLLDSAVGSSGVAVLQRCPGSDAVQLRLLDGFAGDAHWSRDLPTDATDPRLLGADQLLGVVAGNEVQLVSGTDGALLGTLPLADGAPVAQVAAGSVSLVHLGSALRAFDEDSGELLWEGTTIGLPAPDDEPADASIAGTVLVPEENAFVRREARTGAEVGRSAAADLPAGGTASAVGPIVVHRLPDRVVGHR